MAETYINEENKAENFWQNLTTNADSLEEAKKALEEDRKGPPVEKW